MGKLELSAESQELRLGHGQIGAEETGPKLDLRRVVQGSRSEQPG